MVSAAAGTLQDMPSCGCARPALTSLTFGPGILLLRCAAHEDQSWVVDGVETESVDALASLRGVFVERRGHRQPATTTAHPQRRRTDVPVQPAARPAARTTSSTAATAPRQSSPVPTDAQLTAALRARGLTGSWSVA